MEIQIKAAQLDDALVLAKMNYNLIKDEGSRNPMNLKELEIRMKKWLDGEYLGAIILVGGKVAGYCLYQVQKDEYFSDINEVYVRQYYIKPGFRRKHVGSTAFEQITTCCFPLEKSEIALDVIETNLPAKQFWSKLGFLPCYTRYRKTI